MCDLWACDVSGQAIVGSDEPASVVVLRIRRTAEDGRQAEELDVELVRMEARLLADKVRLLELFTAIENFIEESRHDEALKVAASLPALTELKCKCERKWWPGSVQRVSWCMPEC